MMEERYHATTENRFYPDESNVNKNITVDTKLISPPTCISFLLHVTSASVIFTPSFGHVTSLSHCPIMWVCNP